MSILGPNYNEKINELVKQHLQKIHDDQTGTLQSIVEFQKVEVAIRTELWERIHTYEQWSIAHRNQVYRHPITGRPYRYTSFTWQLETSDRVRQCFEIYRGDPKRPRTVAEQIIQKTKSDLYKSSIKPPLQDLKIKLKPEHQLNHPLRRNQVQRKPQRVAQSKAASAALKQFNQTGRVIVPEPNHAKHEADHREWEKHLENISISPTHKRQTVMSKIEEAKIMSIQTDSFLEHYNALREGKKLAELFEKSNELSEFELEAEIDKIFSK